MASQQKELVEELNKHKIEVSKLREILNDLDKEKELWFKKREDFSKKIKETIQKVKDNKSKRDALTQWVKELKPKREGINKKIKEKLSELDKLKKEKIEIAESLGIRESPSRVKQVIEKLEFKIETEPMPFDKEQALMKKIKELKKLYEDSIVVEESDRKIRDASDEIRKMTKEANEVHKLIQERAKQSQVLHEEIVGMSAEIDKMKIDEEGIFKKCSEFKKKFNEINAQLKERLKAMNDVRVALDKASLEKKEKRRAEQELFLKSKEEEINQKIKRREKLTTEDLLVFQKVGRERY